MRHNKKNLRTEQISARFASSFCGNAMCYCDYMGGFKESGVS